MTCFRAHRPKLNASRKCRYGRFSGAGDIAQKAQSALRSIGHNDIHEVSDMYGFEASKGMKDDGIDGLERAIRDWVNLFESRPGGESKPIRLSADSVALHRVKDFGSEWLWYIICESSSHPEQGKWAWSGWAIKAGSGGWTVNGIAGGGGHPLLTGRPWVNLGCQFLEDGFRAGGWVEDAGRQITDVRLIGPAGVELTDQIENQVALFRADRPVELPVTVQLIDATGAVAASHQLF